MRKTLDEALNYNWSVFQRRQMYYADGRSNSPDLGRHSLGTRNRAEANQQLHLLDRKLAIENGIVVEPLGDTAFPAIPIGVGMGQYLDHCRRPRVMGGKTEGTIKRYRSVGDKFAAFCKKKGIASWQGVSKMIIEQYGGDLDRQEYAQRTISLEMHLVQHVVHWFIDEKRLPEQMRMKLGLKKLTGSDTYCYSRAEVSAILDHCKSDADLAWLYDLLATLAMTGIRIGEAVQLRHADIEWEPRPILRIADEGASHRKAKMKSARKTKGKRGRIVPIHPDLASVLQRIERNRDGYVFHGPRGGRLKADTARVIFKRDVVEPLADQFPTEVGDIGFVHARFHSFRHYFVSQCSAAGASDGQIMDWVGHKDSEMVSIYRHQFDAAGQERMQSIRFTSP